MRKLFILTLVLAFGAGAPLARAGDDTETEADPSDSPSESTSNLTNTGGNFFATPVQVAGDLCAGEYCTDGETNALGTVRIDSDLASISFNDGSTLAGFPTNDWEIQINDHGSGGRGFFAIDDTTAGKRMLEIEAGTGRVAIGTGAPVAPLTVMDGVVGAGNSMLLLQRAGGPMALQLKDSDNGAFWNIAMSDNADGFRFSRSGTGKVELELDSSGNLYLQGNVYANGQTLTPLNRSATDQGDAELRSMIAELEARVAELEAVVGTP